MVPAGIRSTIEVDKMIASMRRVGKPLLVYFKETSKDGLAATPTTQKIEKRLAEV